LLVFINIKMSCRNLRTDTGNKQGYEIKEIV
jgi:hypothetical protein